MKTLFIGLIVTLLLATFVFVWVSGAAIVEIGAWAGRRKTRGRD